MNNNYENPPDKVKKNNFNIIDLARRKKKKNTLSPNPLLINKPVKFSEISEEARRETQQMLLDE
ncbi:hypothetical protein [Paenibacillus sp. OAS669]|uniref:hypothetical protein n=1 Tax=Paenibacillus sp. OAS669 TaxID=2663821 RepID=UPI00178922B0|nr:hypothetical protein [Paenibacillus sp. OAS669]MBE1446091.1 hypothetical protein [Paenibacillus sp. OAS669]